MEGRVVEVTGLWSRRVTVEEAVVAHSGNEGWVRWLEGGETLVEEKGGVAAAG